MSGTGLPMKRKAGEQGPCIRVCNCHGPHCKPVMNSYSAVIKRNVKSLSLVAIIVILAAFVVNCWQTNMKKFAQADIQTEYDEQPQKWKVERNKGTDSMEVLSDKVYSLQGDVAMLRHRISGEVDPRKIKALEDKIRLLDLDKTGRPDFALEKSGGCILTVRKTNTYSGGSATVPYLGIPLVNFKSDPRSIIQKGVSPGECWALEGDKGTVVIQLISYVFITHISIEHIPKELSPNGRIDSAPRFFSIKGLTSVDSVDPHNFGLFEYNSEGPAIQTFKVLEEGKIPYNIVELTIHSNHGNPNFTCVYRIRVHGKMLS